jgi:hypothetical protein
MAFRFLLASITGRIPRRNSMKIRARSLLVSVLPALFLLGSKTTYAAVPTPTPNLKPGQYTGTVNLTTMHQFSVDESSASTETSIDMVNSMGNIDIMLSSNRSWSITLDIPVPITVKNNMTIKDKDSKCKGWSITGSGYGTAKGTALHAPALVSGTYTGPFDISTMGFALSSLSARIKKNGECPSESWGPSLRGGVEADFIAIFESKWIFSVTHVGGASLSGTCDSEAWGKAEGQKLECSWRAYWVPSEE